jgi:hypothetical protein
VQVRHGPLLSRASPAGPGWRGSWIARSVL